ncbi:hypothetical protein BGX26_010176 [Mortierella sp. AD094]|nr:hypothetical protein BGX26_010176 [Mortierella sp. AD094]
MERDIEVMPWLQEAIQMVTLLEGRLVELEEDCQSIPLYEQDRAQMIQVIQELDMIVQLDQAWMENTENAIRWTCFALEEALLSSGAKQGLNSVTMARPLERKARSECMLPSLAIVSAPIANTNADTADSSSDSSTSKLGPISSNGQQEGLEAIYRNAIMTALRHLKTIERSQSTKSETTNIGDNNDDSNSAKKNLPNPSLERWLENASMKSLLSDKSENQCSDARSLTMEVDEDAAKINFSDRNDDSCGNMRPLNQPRVDRSEDRRDPALNPTIPNFVDHPLYSKGPMMESTQLQDPSQKASAKALPDLSASAASFQATISGSSQSLQTNLGGCLMDERIFLKQHIQELDRLRVQEQECHQRTEQIHHQLILDLTRFSKELLHNVNDLTCAQAALDEARELALMTFKSAKGTITSITASNSDSHAADSTKRTKRMISTSTKALTESMTMVEQGIKRMRTLAADCVGITELAQTQSQNQNTTMASVVADATDALLDQRASASATSLMLTPNLPRTEFSNTGASASIASHSLLTVPAPSSPLPALASALDQKPSSIFVDGIVFQEFEGHLASLRSTLGSISKKLLNSNINNRAKNSLASNGALIATASGATLQTPSPLPQLLSSALSSTIEMTPFMKRVLAEDIYPCLLTHPKPAVPVKQNGWMSSLLYSSNSNSSTTTSSVPVTATSVETTNNINNSPSTYNFNQQTPWFQRLIKAMERNACEVEFWKTNRRQRQDSTATTSTLISAAIAVAAAPKASCCLCGIVRPCEFKLRIVDNENSVVVAANTKANSKVNNADQQQQQHPLDRFCRDRIVAVCDIYMFLAHLRQGLLDHQSDLELFRKALWLRQRMGCARIGSIDIVQTSPTTPLLEAITRETR